MNFSHSFSLLKTCGDPLHSSPDAQNTSSPSCTRQNPSSTCSTSERLSFSFAAADDFPLLAEAAEATAFFSCAEHWDTAEQLPLRKPDVKVHKFPDVPSALAMLFPNVSHSVWSHLLKMPPSMPVLPQVPQSLHRSFAEVDDADVDDPLVFEEDEDLVFEEDEDLVFEEDEDLVFEDEEDLVLEEDLVFDDEEDFVLEDEEDFVLEEDEDLVFDDEEDFVFEDEEDFVLEEDEDLLLDVREDDALHTDALGAHVTSLCRHTEPMPSTYASVVRHFSL